MKFSANFKVILALASFVTAQMPAQMPVPPNGFVGPVPAFGPADPVGGPPAPAPPSTFPGPPVPAVNAVVPATVTATNGTMQVIGALYTQANDKSNNTLVVFDIYEDGHVNFKAAYPTGGKGGSQDYTAFLLADALRSEGSVFVKGDRLFQVNAGSNTIGMWSINPEDPSDLTRIGEPVDSNGDFPVSIHVSPTSGEVCVANAGLNNGVSCFAQMENGLAPVNDSARPTYFVQNTPPSFNNSVNSMSTVLFSRDGQILLADVKGLTDENIPGYLIAWLVNPDGSTTPYHDIFPAPYKQATDINRSRGGAINFGMSYLPEGHEGYIVADPSMGAMIYDFSGGYGRGQWSVHSIPIEGQSCVCWATYANKSDSYFFTDFGNQQVYELTIDLDTFDSKVVNKFQLDNTTVNIDHRLATIGDNQFLFQLAPYGSIITVFDVQPDGMTKPIQTYNFSQPLKDAGVPFTPYSPAGLYYSAKH